MKLYSKVLTIAAAAAMFTAPIFAQGAPVKVDIPFAFHVGNQELAAGSYEVKVNPSTLLILINAGDGKNVAMTIGYGGPSAKGSEDIALKFRVYGNTRFLAGLVRPGEMDVAVGAAHLEREMARAEKPVEVALVIAPQK